MSDANATTKPARRPRSVPAPTQAGTAFDGLQNLADFQAANASIFPSLASLRWFYAKNRAALISGGAVTMIAGRLLVNAEAFARLAIEIGNKAAAQR